MKKILILGGAGPHTKVVESAKEMGIYTIVADYLPDSPAKKAADEGILMDIYDTDALTDYCKKNSVNGVIAFALDPTQKPAQKIAKNLGLPVFGDDYQVECLTQKRSFKALCKKAGVDVIPEYSLDKPEEICFPCLVKPAESRGSRGITICNSLEEVKQAAAFAKECSLDGECVIEKYMDKAADLTISYLIKDGKARLVSLGDRYPGRKEDNLDRQLTGTIQPSKYIDLFLEKADKKIRYMLEEVLLLKNGPAFFQGFVDKDTIRLYDPGIRYPGNEYERILKQATGVDLMKSLVSFCTGGEILDYGDKIKECFYLNGKICLQYMINVGPGTIGKISGLEEIKEAPFVIDVQQRHFVGDVIENTGDIKHRGGEISILMDRNMEKFKQAIEFVQSKLVIEDIHGKNQIISPFDVENNLRGY